MSESPDPDFAELPDRIAELGQRLHGSPHEDVARDVQLLLSMVDEFHRTGLTTLMELIDAWRGEVFMEAVQRDPKAGALLRAYNL